MVDNRRPGTIIKCGISAVAIEYSQIQLVSCAVEVIIRTITGFNPGKCSYFCHAEAATRSIASPTKKVNLQSVANLVLIWYMQSAALYEQRRSFSITM